MKSYKLMMLMLASSQAFAITNVVTTTSDLEAIVKEVGADSVDVSTIAKGTQDPHYIEAKPSYMTKISRADLVVAIGMELEIGYLPPLLRGARNPNVMPGQKGFLEVGPLIKPLEIPSGKLTRADGDVHPDGNPHVLLDPIRVGEIALKIAERLGQLNSAQSSAYQLRAKALADRLRKKTEDWQARISKSGVKKVVTYHKTLTYFLDRFGIENSAILEPKPGIPPTASHILEVIQIMKDQNVKLVMIENYFDSSPSKRIQQEVPQVRVDVVPVSVGGDSASGTFDDLFERLVKSIEGKA